MEKDNEELSIKQFLDEQESNETIVSGNDIYKRQANFELTESKNFIISKIKLCTYRTSPFIVAKLLDEFFADPNTKPNHWLNISQIYPPRRIYLTIRQMVKRQGGGWITIKNPAAYFTYLIKFRKKRKSISINGTR